MTTVPVYQLRVDGFSSEAFRVHSLRGREALSEAYVFDVVATADSGSDAELAALGKRAVLIFNTGKTPRGLHGVVAAVRVAGVHEPDDRIAYEFRLVPRLWLLKRKRRTRIFQRLRVPDIVSSVLAEAGITTRWLLTRAYPEREYCTQYDETDYRFVTRLLAEAGIYFYFFGGGPASDWTLVADAGAGTIGAAGGVVAGSLAVASDGALAGVGLGTAEALVPGDTVVCADDASCYPAVAGDDPAALTSAAAVAPTGGDAPSSGGGAASAEEAPVLHFLAREDATLLAGYDQVTRFALRNSVRSSAATFRDYDPARPMVRLQSMAVSTQPFPPSPFEVAAHAAATTANATSAVPAAPSPTAPAGGAVTPAVGNAETLAGQVGSATGQKVPLEVYDHHGPFLFPKWEVAGAEAPRLLRQQRRRASIARGEGGCSDFSPGHRFSLQDHPAPQLDGAYVVTSVEHRGETQPGEAAASWRVYSNTFECVPAVMTYPPPRPKRRSVQVSLTATVVGPAGEEIHVDAMGQIKVQFHWDREGKLDDQSSCWIRVMQPWAGAAWGTQFIPRVGMEVVVVFECGDPDKPMVLGSLYNGTHPPPFRLPGDKTRSGFRTQTSPGGGGSNELSFEDAAGQEQVYLHAQRDLDEEVTRRHTTVVGEDQRTEVHGDQHNEVSGDQYERIGGSRNREVIKDQTEHFAGNVTERVEQDRTSEIGGNRLVRVNGTSKETVTGDAVLLYRDGCAVHIQGQASTIVGTQGDAGKSDLYVFGDHVAGAEGNLTLVAKKSITLQCGDSAISLTPDGLKIGAKLLALAGAQGVSVKGKGPALNLGDEGEIVAKSFKIFAEGASLELGKDAHLRGQQVLLNCDTATPPEEDPSTGRKKTKPLKVKLSDVALIATAGKRFKLLVDGNVYEGTTGADGTVEQEIPDTATSATVLLWPESYPEGPRRQWNLSLQELAPAASPAGAALRLRNLGYYSGTVSDDLKELPDPVVQALKDFQKDHGVTASGQLDGATAAKLQNVYGH